MESCCTQKPQTAHAEKRGDTVAGKGQAEPGKLGAASDDRFRGGGGGQDTQGPSILPRDPGALVGKACKGWDWEPDPEGMCRAYPGDGR